MEFRKNSFSDEDSATLAKVAALYQNVADDAVSASDAASLIISQIKAFNIEADNAIDIVNAINSVSNQFAVSSTDISSALTKTSSAMSVLGNDFQHTIGLITAGAEILTGQAGKVARGIRTIGNKFADAAQEADSIEYSVGGVIKTMSLLDETTGDIKSTFDIFGGLKKDWDAMSNAEKQALAITYAGQTQFEVFAAVMNNFQSAIDATAAAFDSAGSAVQENAKYMDSVAAAENQLKAEFEDFSNRVLSKEFVTSVLDAGQALLSFANNDVGAAITRIAGLTAGSFALVGILGQVAKALKTIMGFGSTLTTLGKVATTVGIVVAALTALVEIIKAINNAVDANKYENLIVQYRELNKEVAELSENLTTARDRLQELNSVDIANRTSEWEEETAALREQIEAYEFLLELKKRDAAETLAAAMQADVTTGVKVSQVADGIYSQVDAATGMGQMSDIKGSGYLIEYRDAAYMTAHPELEGNKAAFTTDQIVALTREYENQEEAIKALSLAFSELYSESDLEAIAAAIAAGDIEEALRLRAENLKLIGIVFEETSQTADEYMMQQADVAKKLSNAITEAAESNYNLTAAQKEEIEEYVTANKERYQYVKSLDNQTEAQSKFAAAYESFAHDVASYNVDSGLMSVGEAAIYLGNTLGLAEDDVNALQAAIYNIDSSSLYTLMNDAIKAGNGLDLVRRYAELLSGTGLNVSGILSGLNNIANTAANAYGMLYKLRVLAAGGSGELFKQEYEETSPGSGIWVPKGSTSTVTTGAISSGKKSGKSSGGSSKTTDTQLEALKDIVSLRESELTVLEKQGKPISEQVAKNKEIQAALHNQAEYMRSVGASQEEINELSAKWWTIQNDINELLNEAMDTVKEGLEEQADNINDALSYAIKMAEAEIDNINDKYDQQLETLENSNDALERQITLEEKLKAIAEAKAKKLYVYKDGRFQYVDDVEAISAAQQEYDEYKREQQLEEQQDAIEAARDAEIKIWQDYIDNWENVVDSYTDSQDKLLAEQVLGIQFEAENWAERLGNAQEFARQYSSIMSQIAQIESMQDAGQYVDLNTDYSALMDKATTAAEFNKYAALRDAKATALGIDIAASGYRTSEEIRKSKGFAAGTLGAPGGLSVVGERGAELRVLNSGDGIIPADITRNLWAWGKLDPNTFSKNQNYTFNIDNLALPGVTNAQSFLTGLRQMAYQRAYGRA